MLCNMVLVIGGGHPYKRCRSTILLPTDMIQDRLKDYLLKLCPSRRDGPCRLYYLLKFLKIIISMEVFIS